MNYETLQVAINNRVAWVTLNRPDALNALSVTMLAEIEALLHRLENDDDARVLVLTGAGRAFCAGADLKGVAAEAASDQPAKPFLERVQACFLKLRAFPKPVIAALNGVAMGGGLELAMCCDIIVAADDAKIADAHANVGVLPGAGGCAVLPRLIGAPFAKLMVFSGETVLAPELHRLGLIARLFPREGLADGARALAERIADKSPLGLRHMKRLIDQGLEQANVATALSMELVANASYGHSLDFAEGMAAFAERRKPVFVGR